MASTLSRVTALLGGALVLSLAVSIGATQAGAPPVLATLAGGALAAAGLGAALALVRREVAERERILAETARLQDALLASASRELRAPVDAIQSALKRLAGGSPVDLPESARELAEAALGHAGRLSRLVEDILDADRLEAGARKVRLQRVELQPIVEAALVLDRAFAERFEVHFRLEGPLPHAFVDADPERLGQVLSNLLSNAAKFSPRGATVRVAIERRQGRLRVTVADRGQGIPEGFRPRVFERFAQADAADARSQGGVGLGLAVAKALMERQGGGIGFETGPGGSTFWFELKEMPAPPAPRASREELTMSAEILRSVAAARDD